MSRHQPTYVLNFNIIEYYPTIELGVLVLTIVEKNWNLWNQIESDEVPKKVIEK